MSNFKRIAIMGGTFDPIHFGHLVAAEAARDIFKLDRVFFVPSGNPPHKKNYPVTDAKHRYLMTNLAVAANPYFEVSSIEIEREGYSYAIDTVTEFYNRYKSQAELFFITGADAILEILTWKNVERLTELCRFIAATRPGTHLDELLKFIKKLPDKIGKKIHIMEVPALAISSTDIRQRVANHRTIKYLLPEAVEQYIVKNGLYQT
ncbi:MAG: nicotinate-nucleotide adenylyltransferase [Zhaonellaceae bacterium]|jgi:nicotinate-nucleotide adenylyltransferase|nr:nicotinate-nucleotide adenylyltransferase [Clostridia bacterium]